MRKFYKFTIDIEAENEPDAIDKFMGELTRIEMGTAPLMIFDVTEIIYNFDEE